MHLSKIASSCSGVMAIGFSWRIAVHADLVAGLGDRLHLLGEGLDRMRRDEPGGLDAEALEQAQKARRADLAREHAARDVARAVLAAVRAEPAGDRIDVDAVRAQDLLGHDASPRLASWFAGAPDAGRRRAMVAERRAMVREILTVASAIVQRVHATVGIRAGSGAARPEVRQARQFGQLLMLHRPVEIASGGCGKDRTRANPTRVFCFSSRMPGSGEHATLDPISPALWHVPWLSCQTGIRSRSSCVFTRASRSGAPFPGDARD